MSISRRTALSGAACGAALSILNTSRAEAAEFTLRLGHDQATTAPLHVRALEAAKAIADESSGRVAIEIFPNNQLGTDIQMIAEVRSGALELLITGYNIWGSVIPSANVATIPFSFDNLQQEWAAMDGALGKYIHAEFEKAGLRAFDVDWEGEFRQIFTTSRAIHTAADVKGLKLRVAASPIGVALFRALGASPTPMDTSEIYSGLQTHLLDGGETGLESILYSKFYEVAKFISLTNHQASTFPVIANRAAFSRLPSNLQDIVLHNFNEAGKRDRDDVAQEDAIAQKQMEAQGTAFTTPDHQSFKKVVQDAGLYKRWQDTYGAEPFRLLEEVVGKLA